MSQEIKLHFVNASRMRIETDRSLLMELSEKFTFLAHNYRFTPSYKKGYWDGKIRMIDMQKSTCYVGLIYQIADFCKDRGITLRIHDSLKAILKGEELNTEAFSSFLELPENKQPRYYQHDTLGITSKYNRAIILSPTASGKSLSIYMLIRFLIQKHPDIRILLVVPRVSLVLQMVADFKEYSTSNNWDVDANCYQVYAGQEKLMELPVCISTYQSIYKLPESFFERFTAIINDEVHEATAASLRGILEKCNKAVYRVGFTGTLDESETNEMALTGMFGKVHRVAHTATLIEEGSLSRLDIVAHTLEYPPQHRQTISAGLYADEIAFITDYAPRTSYICSLASKLKGNVLILTSRVDHAKDMVKEIQKLCPDREVYYYAGAVKGTKREEIRQSVNVSASCVIVATYGVMSTGLNIPRLHHAIFATPYKAKVKVLQSIGRILRKAHDKDVATLHDIVDDLSWKKRLNHTMKHFMVRCRLYSEEGHILKMNTHKIEET